MAGDEGPRAYSSEKRRHVYRQGEVPVRIKIIKESRKNRATNAYRVTDVATGVTGWQFKKPEGSSSSRICCQCGSVFSGHQ